MLKRQKRVIYSCNFKLNTKSRSNENDEIYIDDSFNNNDFL